MSEWYATDLVTQIAILPGEEVVIIPIVEKISTNGNQFGCNSLYTFLYKPLTGTYDGVGGLTGYKDQDSSAFLKFIKEQIAAGAISIYENYYEMPRYDEPYSEDIFEEKTTQEILHDICTGKYGVYNSSMRYRTALVYIRKSTYEGLLKTAQDIYPNLKSSIELDFGKIRSFYQTSKELCQDIGKHFMENFEIATQSSKKILHGETNVQSDLLTAYLLWHDKPLDVLAELTILRKILNDLRVTIVPCCGTGSQARNSELQWFVNEERDKYSTKP